MDIIMLAVRGQAELLRIEIPGRLLHLNFFRNLKLLCYFGTYGFFDTLFDEFFDNFLTNFFEELF